MTSRETILDHYRIACETLKPTTIKNVSVNKLDSRDIRDTKLPAIWIFSGAERRGDFKYGQEWWDWDIIVQVWADNEDMEELLSLVNTAIYSRYVAEEFVEVLYRKSAELFIVDSDGEEQGWTLIYKNIYGTDKGTT